MLIMLVRLPGLFLHCLLWNNPEEAFHRQLRYDSSLPYSLCIRLDDNKTMLCHGIIVKVSVTALSSSEER
jgi:hypothetical protein